MNLSTILRAMAYPALLYVIAAGGYAVVAVAEGATSPEALAFLVVFSLLATALGWVRHTRRLPKEI